jgi:hypothetical protein
MAVDLLSRAWGLYFNAMAYDYGSSDMMNVVLALDPWRHIYASRRRMQNTDRLECLAYGLLYARLLILEYCLSITGSKDTFSCKRWMLLQVATPAFKDVFQALFVPISEYMHRHFILKSITVIVQEQFNKIRELLRDRHPSSVAHSKFLVIIDESQVLGRLLPTKYLDIDGKTSRPALAPVLSAFRQLADTASGGSICVMPCSTSLGKFELTWSEDIASGIKSSMDEYVDAMLLQMVVDFDEWTDDTSISAYLERLGQGLSDEARRRLVELIPQEAVQMLFRDLRGRFHPIVSTIEDIIVMDGHANWEQCIYQRVYRLTTTDNPVNYGPLLGNLCGRLGRMSSEAHQDESSLAYAEFHNMEATLELAVAMFFTQGGYMAFTGQLLKLVEAGFGRMELISDNFYTTINEPFALRAANNYFQGADPECFQIPFEMVHLFHNKVISTRLFHDDTPPHSMFEREADVVGWTGVMRTASSQEMSMSDFLDAHVNHNSMSDGQPVPPFFYPEERVSGPDIVFVVRFGGLTPDDAMGSGSTPSSGSTSSEIFCPVFVQLQLCEKISQDDPKKTRGTVQPRKIKSHKVEFSQLCQPHGHYINLAVSYPVSIANYVMDRSLEKHMDGLTEIALTIDDHNIDDVFSEKHAQAREVMKQLADKMVRTAETAKRHRG